MNAQHFVTAKQRHNRFSSAIPPVLTVAPGDTVIFDTPDAIDNRLSPGSPSEAILAVPEGSGHQLNGPVAVAGAEPGDTLVVEILSIDVANWGWSAIIPHFGLLQDDAAFEAPYLHHWDLSSQEYAAFNERIRVPFEPFCGVMGVAPVTTDLLPTGPPRENGGNMDIKQAQPGSTISFPVLVAGANFSLGDVHAAQGDGEVCGTGIECQATVVARFDVVKGQTIAEPTLELPGSMPGSWNTAGWKITTAHGPDLYENSQRAVRTMIEYLTAEHDLTPQEAYVLCSACGDLKIAEIVDAPNWLVSFSFPLGVFANWNDRRGQRQL
ncbi:MAG: acetamidase/formamidase family protein [Thermomicrobiales bacterium]